MNFTDAIKKSVLEGFAGNDIPTSQVLTVLCVTFLIGIYIYVIYKLVNKTSMYDRSYHVAMSLLSVITAGIILAMQSSIVISLGMVGALSIVRFRTAIKDTMDLLFLFWSIGEGIICGAGLFKIAIIVALMVTVGVFVLQYFPGVKKPYLLIVNCDGTDAEDDVMDSLKKYCKGVKVKLRNMKNNSTDYMMEVYTVKEKELLSALDKLEKVTSVSLLTNEGEIRF